MKEVIRDLIKAQKHRLVAEESVLLKKFLDNTLPTKRVNASSVLPMPQRFLTKLAFGGGDCWTWRASVNRLGYGVFPYQGETKAHRVSYLLFNGAIPNDMFVLHKCDNRQCVNPDHLFVGTQKDNMVDMRDKGRGKFPRLVGELNPMSKLTHAETEAIRMTVESGEKQIDVAKKYGVSPMTISRIVRRDTWK